ncbi:nuclear envelope integral membrane protein 2 [Ambystoma mexicanum]|uniref:nuclear envelope integral membrane protein 2 n=1 Tax=Ambystoma mexicanum TaxID=8296 RepID=UPI0037E8AA9F
MVVSLFTNLAFLILLSPALNEASDSLAVKRCTLFKDTDTLDGSRINCFCHVPNTDLQFRNIWSTIQVAINSTDPFVIVHISNKGNCQSPENISVYLKCALHNLWQWAECTKQIINLNEYDDDACFQVQPTDPHSLYTIHARRNGFDIRLFLVFCSGLFLVWYSNALSRSAAFHYSAGVAIGILATLVLFLLILKRFISKYSTFVLLTTASFASSLYIFNYLMENMVWLWHENKSYLLGYFLTTGLLSFAVCYQHGPLTNPQSIDILTWTLQIIGCLLIYLGVAITPVAHGLVVTLIISKILYYPVKLFHYICRKFRGCFPFNKPAHKFITEEEYRDQGEIETYKALEELRSFCRSPEFPSWEAVSKIHLPKRFAEFVCGSNHLSPEEMRVHDEQYGPGGLFFEEQLFTNQGEHGQPVNNIQVDEVAEDEENQLDSDEGGND